MSYAYEVRDQTVEPSLDPDFIAVRFPDRHPLTARARAARAWSAGLRSGGMEIAEENIALMPLPLLQRRPTQKSENETEQTIRDLREFPDVQLCMPVFRVGDRQAFVTDRVTAGLYDVASWPEVSERYGLQVIEIRDDKMVCRPSGGTDIFALVAAMAGDGDVRFAEPDFITVGAQSPMTRRSAVPQREGRRPFVELATSMANCRKATSVKPTDGCPLTVRIGPAGLFGGRWKTTNSTIARSINWARKAGADILINRWGGGLPSNDIIEEIERARLEGRNGLGCVIIVAAPNPDGPSGFPAMLPDVLPVPIDGSDDKAAASSANGRVADHVTSGGFGYRSPRRDENEVSLPAVSGACALVLAANPTLTEAQVRRLVGGTMETGPCTENPLGNRHSHGPVRLDMLTAIHSALMTAP